MWSRVFLKNARKKAHASAEFIPNVPQFIFPLEAETK